MGFITLSFLIVCGASAAVAVFICLYHLGLMTVGLVCRRKEGLDSDAPRHAFAIVIPAHNEESTIARALDSCAALDYPKEKLAVYVIADNCSDRTAEVVMEHNAICLVRRDDARKGKGFALGWAFPKILAAGHDAILVLDADCWIESHALRAFDRRLRSGDMVLQANNVIANPDQSPTTYLLAVANVLENDCFYAPKSLLGLAVLLRGTGMAFCRDVLLKFPWQAQSIAEDAEYSCRLLQEGVPIRFVPEVRVLSDSPAEHGQLAVQRARWIGGGLRTIVAWGPALAWKTLTEFRLLRLDAILTMLVTSRPAIAIHLLLTMLLGIACWRLCPGPWSGAVLISGMAVGLSYFIYAAVGAALLGVRAGRVALLLRSPLVIVNYLYMAVKSLLRRDARCWNRTPRIPACDPRPAADPHGVATRADATSSRLL